MSHEAKFKAKFEYLKSKIENERPDYKWEVDGGKYTIKIEDAKGMFYPTTGTFQVQGKSGQAKDFLLRIKSSMSEQEKTNMMRAQYHEQIALQNNSMSHMAQQNTELVGQVSYLMKKVEFLGTENVYLRQKVAEHDVSIQSLQSEMTQMHQTMQQMQQWFHQQQQ